MGNKIISHHLDKIRKRYKLGFHSEWSFINDYVGKCSDEENNLMGAFVNYVPLFEWTSYQNFIK